MRPSRAPSSKEFRLATEEMIQLWDHLEEEMRSLIADAPLSEDCACETNEYLTHSEFGLALDMLSACLRDADEPIRARLHAIEQLMYPPDLGW
jgi:hypothetical protein